MDALRSVSASTLAASLRNAPFLLCAALALTLGDVVAGRGPTLPAPVLAGGAAVASVFLFAADPLWKRAGIALLALVFGNVAAHEVYHPTFAAHHVAAAAMHVPLNVEGVLGADAEALGDRTRLWLQAERVDDGEEWRATEGIVLVTVLHVQRNWCAGDRLRATLSLRRTRNFGNPGEFDAEGYWARRGVYVTAFADDDDGFLYLGHAGNWATEWLARWRRSVGALFRRTLPEPQSAVLSALIIGTESALSRDLRSAFSRAGVSHVLSISGLHVALVAAGAYALFRWLLARSRWLLLTINVPKLAVVLSVIPVLLYAEIAGSNVATTRSVIMILMFLGAVVVDRQRHLLASLAAAALVILLVSPGAARDVSFQLSFVAVLGLVWGMERFWPWWQRWEEAHLLRLRGWRARVWRSLAVYAVVSFSALAATIPLTALHFNQISLVAPFANAVVVPLLGSAAVTLGLLAALLYTISEPLAQLCVTLAGPFLWLGVRCVEFFAAWPAAALRVVTPTTFELALMYAALYALVRLEGHARALSLAVLAIAGVTDGASWYADRYHRSDLRITFLSVGQGDSAVVEFPGAEVMVIDGGGLSSEAFDVGERVVAPFLWSRKIAHVDYLALSHPDWDHYGGLAFLAAHFSPHEFWSNGTAAPSERFAALQQALTENAVRPVVLQRNERRGVGTVDVEAQSPLQLEGVSVNDRSLVLRLTIGGTHVLFPGDIEMREEEALVALSDGALKSTVLKMPHHGSHTSSTAAFLDAVAPQLAVASVGFENRFGFPHPDVLDRYAARQCAVARTDLDGAVQLQIASDGRISAQTYRDDLGYRSGARPPCVAR